LKQLLILSGKGGTGKTTIASAFIKLSKAKAYADCDVDAPNLHLTMVQSNLTKKTNYFGMPKAHINVDLCIRCNLCIKNCRFDAINDNYEVNRFSCEGCGVCKAICPENVITLNTEIAGEIMLYADKTVFSTAELKMGHGTSGLLVTEVKNQMQRTARQADLAIIDGSPGIGCPVIASLNGVDMVLIVSEPSISGMSDMERIIKTATKFQTKIAVCINKYDINIENTKKIEYYCKKNDLSVVGRIPYDNTVVTAINHGNSIVDIDCIASRAIKDIYKKTIHLLDKKI